MNGIFIYKFQKLIFVITCSFCLALTHTLWELWLSYLFAQTKHPLNTLQYDLSIIIKLYENIAFIWRPMPYLAI